MTISPAGQPPSRADLAGEGAPAASAGAVAGSNRVIICDADPASRRHVDRILSATGFEAFQCETAAACVDLVASVRPALVVLSVLLPDLDGLALARRLAGGRADGGPAPRILIVSVLQAEQRALEAGADAFLLKPVSRADLVSVAMHLAAPAPKSEPDRP